MTETATEPTGVSQVVTPSGIEIYYQSGPKRLYRIRVPQVYVETPTGPELYLDPDWEEVPSVSTVLGVLDKPALVWWGMKVGVAGLSQLYGDSVENTHRAMMDGDVESIVEMLKAKKLTVNHQRDKAADRGTNVHSALEAWAETGITPDPRFYPENERGYVQGLVNFINDANPKVIHSELMVASLDGFAGRFDLLAEINGDVVTKTYPKREDIRENVDGIWLLDMKTSKDVYPSYHLQLAAYWRGMGECGYGVPDTAGVIRVTSDGRYELVESRAIYQDFKTVLDAYNAVERIKGK